MMNLQHILQTTSISLQLAVVGLLLLVLMSMATVALHPGTPRRRFPRASGGRRARRGSPRETRQEPDLLLLLARVARALHAWAALRIARREEPKEEPREDVPEIPAPLLHAEADPESRRELKRLYRALMKAWHPDRCPDPQRKTLHAEQAIRINDLYERRDLSALRKLHARLEWDEENREAQGVRA